MRNCLRPQREDVQTNTNMHAHPSFTTPHTVFWSYQKKFQLIILSDKTAFLCVLKTHLNFKSIKSASDGFESSCSVFIMTLSKPVGVLSLRRPSTSAMRSA